MTIFGTNRAKFHLLPVIGAGIALLGYVSKEIVLDHYKKLSDGLNAARVTYETRVDLHMIAARINETDYHPNNREDLAKDFVYAMGDQVGSIASSMHELWPLIDALPDNERFEDRYKELHTKLDKAEETYQRVMTELATIEGEQSQNATKTPFPTQKLNDDIFKERARSRWDFSELGKELLSDTISAADYAREQLHRKELIWSWISYTFYIIGWAMALYGKFHGEEVGSSSE